MLRELLGIDGKRFRNDVRSVAVGCRYAEVYGLTGCWRTGQLDDVVRGRGLHPAGRVVMIGNDPWFYGTDVAKALGYERPNDAVNAHCKKINKFSYGDSPQGATPYNIIPESDVYRQWQGGPRRNLASGGQAF